MKLFFQKYLLYRAKWLEAAILQADGKYEDAAILYQKFIGSPSSKAEDSDPGEKAELMQNTSHEHLNVTGFITEQLLTCHASLGDWSTITRLFVPNNILTISLEWIDRVFGSFSQCVLGPATYHPRRCKRYQR
jgi:hypothetical protein